MGKWPLWSSGSQVDPEDKSGKPRESQKPTTNQKDASSIFSSSSSSSPSARQESQWNSILNATDWEQFKEPGNLIPTVLLTSGILLVIHLHRKYLRRIPQATNISPSSFRRKSLLGQVTSVGDGDNFRIFHTPGGRLAGWGWLPWKGIPTSKKELKDRTIHVRLAGVDAPELAHFGRPEQPFAKEAHNWLISYLSNRRVRAYVHRPDQYQRVVATVYIRRFWDFPIPLRRRDVSYEMLIRGLATVYEAKTGAEFGGEKREREYREAEQLAKAKGRGLWKEYQRTGGRNWESPRDYKNRMNTAAEDVVERQEETEHTSILASLRNLLFGGKQEKK